MPPSVCTATISLCPSGVPRTWGWGVLPDSWVRTQDVSEGPWVGGVSVRAPGRPRLVFRCLRGSFQSTSGGPPRWWERHPVKEPARLTLSPTATLAPFRRVSPLAQPSPGSKDEATRSCPRASPQRLGPLRAFGGVLIWGPGSALGGGSHGQEEVVGHFHNPSLSFPSCQGVGVGGSALVS